MAARAIASCTRRTGASTIRGEQQVEEEEHEQEGERHPAVEERARRPLAPLEGGEALQEVEAPVGLPRRGQRRHEGEHALAPEEGLPELVLAGGGPAPGGTHLLALDAPPGHERPPARADEVGLAVLVHQEDDARLAEVGVRVRSRRGGG